MVRAANLTRLTRSTKSKRSIRLTKTSAVTFNEVGDVDKVIDEVGNFDKVDET